MRGSTLVNAIREDNAKYPNICRMIIYLYDEKDEEHISEDAVYIEDLFAKNTDEKARFLESLIDLERNTPAFMDVKITESHVILFHKTPREEVFSRRDKLTPLDYN